MNTDTQAVIEAVERLTREAEDWKRQLDVAVRHGQEVANKMWTITNLLNEPKKARIAHGAFGWSPEYAAIAALLDTEIKETVG